MKQEILKQIPVSDITYSGTKVIARFETEPPESEELDQLTNSIKRIGVKQPIIIRPKGANGYEVVAGNRRLRAARIAKLETIPAVIEDLDDIHARRIGFFENYIRRNIEGIQAAKGLAAIYNDIGIPKEIAIKKVKRQWNHPTKSMTHTFVQAKGRGGVIDPEADPTPKFLEIFDEIPISANRQYVLLSLITKLAEPTQESATEEKLSANKAQLLTHSRLKDFPLIQEYLVTKIAGKNVSFNKAKQIVDQMIMDIEAKNIWEENGQIIFGTSKAKEEEEAEEEEEEPTEETFDIKIPDFRKLLLKTIGKLLDRPITKGEIFYEPKVYKPKLEEFKKNLNTVKKKDRQWLALDAVVLMQICKIIVDSAK